MCGLKVVNTVNDEIVIKFIYVKILISKQIKFQTLHVQ